MSEQQFSLPGVDLRIKPTTEDFLNAEHLFLEEEGVWLTSIDQLFPLFVDGLLSATEEYGKQKVISHRLKAAGLVTPEAMLENPTALEQIMKTTRYPQVKLQRSRDLAAWWQQTDLADLIYQDVKQDEMVAEYELRARIAKEAPGLAWKCASYVLGRLGYENLVPIDIWMCRVLLSWGVRVKIPDYEYISGPVGREYLRLETAAQKIARDEFGVTPAHLQRALWIRMSGWQPAQAELPPLTSSLLSVPQNLQGSLPF